MELVARALALMAAAGGLLARLMVVLEETVRQPVKMPAAAAAVVVARIPVLAEMGVMEVLLGVLEGAEVPARPPVALAEMGVGAK